MPEAPFIARPGQINAWDNEELVAAVKATGRSQLVIAGVVTDVCVTFPTLSALEAGYEVFVVTDASGTFNRPVRDAAPTRNGARGSADHELVQRGVRAPPRLAQRRRGPRGLLSEHIPNYRNPMTSYAALSK